MLLLAHTKLNRPRPVCQALLTQLQHSKKQRAVHMCYRGLGSPEVDGTCKTLRPEGSYRTPTDEISKSKAISDASPEAKKQSPKLQKPFL